MCPGVSRTTAPECWERPRSWEGPNVEHVHDGGLDGLDEDRDVAVAIGSGLGDIVGILMDVNLGHPLVAGLLQGSFLIVVQGAATRGGGAVMQALPDVNDIHHDGVEGGLVGPA